MDYIILLFYISILLIIFGVHSIKKQRIAAKKKARIPKIIYKPPKNNNYTQIMDNIFGTDNRILLRV